MAERIISIHQPNMSPWQSYFDKIAACDVFILLNHCTFPKNNYVNRFQYNGKWYTMRCNQSHTPIIEKRYIDAWQDWGKIINQLPSLSAFNDCVSDYLHEMNGNIIRRASHRLGIKTQIIDDYETGLTATARLVQLCKDAKATTYLSGPSGKEYLDMQLFEDAKIRVIFHQTKGTKALCEIL